MNSIPIYTVAAFSGTGKTTFIIKLIPELKALGLRVAVIKHDAHSFDIDREGKDSWKISRSGADVVALSSDTAAAVMENRHVPLDELICRIRDVDLIITEGFKHSRWKKIALYRQASGNPLALSPENCFVIMSDDPAVAEGAAVLELDDVKGLAALLAEDIGWRSI